MQRVIGLLQTSLLVGILVAAYYVYAQISQFKTTPDPLRVDMARELAAPLAAAIPLPEQRKRLAVADVQGDFAGILTAELRRALEQRNAVVVQLMPWRNLVPAAIWPRSELSLEQSLVVAKSQQLPLLVFCEVIDWTISPSEEPRLTIKVTFVDVNRHAILYGNEFSTGRMELAGRLSGDIQAPIDVSYPSRFRFENSKTIQPRFAIWLTVCLLYPWLVQGFLRRTHSNPNIILLLSIFIYFAMLVVGARAYFGFEWALITWPLLCLQVLLGLLYFKFVCRYDTCKREHCS